MNRNETPPDMRAGMYRRITELVSLLSDDEMEPTIRKISEITGTTLSQTREDILQLGKAGLLIYPEEVVLSLDRDSGRFDDEILGIDLDVSPGCYLLFLSQAERELFTGSRIRDMLIKDSPNYVPDEVKSRAAVIEAAIRARTFIRFRYRSPVQLGPAAFEIAPRMLFHNTTDDLYYCISFDENKEMMSFRLDRMIHDVKPVRSRHFTDFGESDPEALQLDRMKYMWGAAFNNKEEPARVILEVTPNTPNLLGKIRTDTRGRAFGKLTERDGLYYYTDEIIGLNSFRAWVLSFGSSVRVIEPAELAREIRDSSEKKLLNYEEGGFHH